MIISPISWRPITEFVSVAVHAATRFALASHKRKDIITVWGDGSLSYTVCCVLKTMFKSSKINVVGRDMRKLSHFSFVNNTYISDELPPITKQTTPLNAAEEKEAIMQ